MTVSLERHVCLLFSALPEGTLPIFLSAPTQQIHNCKADEEVTASHPYKLLKKEDILKDLFNRAAICDFHPFKKQIEVLHFGHLDLLNILIGDLTI